MRTTRLCGYFLLCLGILGSSCTPGESEELRPKTIRAPIINGNLDTTHQAVVAVFLGGGACSGTIIQRTGNNAWVLTAAHCVTPTPPQVVAQGNDHNNADRTYPVADFAYHPAYTAPGGIFDFAVIRITGADAATPVIPAQTPAEDNLAMGTQVRHLGYGITWHPNGSTSQRHETINNIDAVHSFYFQYLQPTSGPCSGDSGGPALTVGGAERVAGVISGGDPTCSQYGVSGRVSAVYDSFILPFINGTPFTMTCSECFAGATQGAGACMGQMNACFGNADCDALVGCLDACWSQGCVLGCYSSHPTGYPLYRAIYDCACATGCSTECAGDDMCTRGLGEPCNIGSECGSGYCADGVCCSEACGGQCEACDRSGWEGNCVGVPGAPHGNRPACADDGSGCGGSCNGSLRTACTYPNESDPCGAQGCVGGVFTPSAVCDGAGACVAGASTSCAPYLCNGDICATSCVSSTDCAGGLACEGGACMGTACTGDGDCPGDLVCQDGTCAAPDCQTHADCEGGTLCQAGACVEVACVDDVDCVSGLVCRSNACVPPPSVSASNCNCTSNSGSPSPPALLFLLGLIGVLWRRRCRVSQL